MWVPSSLAADVPLALVISYWLLASASIGGLGLLWLRAQRQSVSGTVATNPFLAQLQDMLTYGKVKETCSERQNVPKAWFGHFYALGSLWHFLCSWLVLDGLWCWGGRHHVHCDRHPPVLSYLIAPPATPLLPQWLLQQPQAYTCASTDEIASVCLSLLLYGAHVWRRLAEECIAPALDYRGRALPSTARMHVAHYLFGMSFYVAAPLSLIASPSMLLTLAGHLPAETEDFEDCSTRPSPVVQWAVRMAAVCIFGRAKSRSYAIPQGDWFFMVSCPHYTAELLIYLAITLILQNYVGALPMLCSAVNLSFTAVNTHRWYLDKFKEVYPQERRWAIVPYVL